MKIGIFTLPLYSNYGGILQAYALQKIIRDLGHDVVTIKENRKIPLWKKPLLYSKRFVIKFLLRRKKATDVFDERIQKKILPIITQHTQPFIDKYIRRIDYDSIKKQIKSFDALVVGSDQVWRPKYVGDVKNAYLAFSQKESIKRIAYAASFGTDKWEYNTRQNRICKELVSKFEAVSVREKSGVQLCKQHFDIDATLVLDPTMLLDTSHYVSLAKDGDLDKESVGELFVYVLDGSDATENIEQQICEFLGYKSFHTSTDNKTATLENRIASKVETWLQSFHLAEFVLTDSFHACVFSILFNKPFVVYGNAARGLSRFDSLLQIFDLQDRLVSTTSVDLKQIIGTPIDWDRVNEILEAQRHKSLDFLVNILKEN